MIFGRWNNRCTSGMRPQASTNLSAAATMKGRGGAEDRRRLAGRESVEIAPQDDRPGVLRSQLIDKLQRCQIGRVQDLQGPSFSAGDHVQKRVGGQEDTRCAKAAL